VRSAYALAKAKLSVQLLVNTRQLQQILTSKVIKHIYVWCDVRVLVKHASVVQAPVNQSLRSPSLRRRGRFLVPGRLLLTS